jgi:hypothetical protein
MAQHFDEHSTSMETTAIPQNGWNYAIIPEKRKFTMAQIGPHRDER